MNIYFAGSITSGRQDVPIYLELIEHLKQYGTVLTEHIGDETLTDKGEVHPYGFIHERDIEWLLDCQVLVAEVTVNSVGVGYEIGWAISKGIDTLLLYRPDDRPKLSSMLDIPNSKFVQKGQHVVRSQYSTIQEAKQCIDDYFTKRKVVKD